MKRSGYYNMRITLFLEAKVRKQKTANSLLVARVTGFGVNLLIG